MDNVPAYGVLTKQRRPIVLVKVAYWDHRREDPVPGQDVPSQSGVVDVTLLNVGLGPALRVVTGSLYADRRTRPR